jgi:lipoprotein signal peptidase
VTTRETRLHGALRRLMGERRRAPRAGAPAGRRASDGTPLYGWRPAVLIALAIAAADWASKALVAAWVPLDHFREVVEGRVAFWHVRNPAMILGLWGDFPLGARKAIAAAAAVVAAVVLLEVVGRAHRLPRAHRRWAWLFVGCVMGGMLGNLGERVVHWGVTDFLSFRWGDYWLPPGNLADIALFASVPLAARVIVFELRARSRRGRRRVAATQPRALAAGD